MKADLIYSLLVDPLTGEALMPDEAGLKEYLQNKNIQQQVSCPPAFTCGIRIF